jgi:hypothetical protein
VKKIVLSVQGKHLKNKEKLSIREQTPRREESAISCSKAYRKEQARFIAPKKLLGYRKGHMLAATKIDYSTRS